MTGVNVSTVQQGYAVNACCKACHNKIAYERRKKKMQERYGVDNPFKSDAVKKKSMQTCLTRYGVKHPLQSAAVKDKVKKSLIAKYGENYKQALWGRHGNIS